MAKHTAAISAPKHLRKESAAFFRNVMNEYVLDEHHVILLTKACESLDRIEEARAIIQERWVGRQRSVRKPEGASGRGNRARQQDCGGALVSRVGIRLGWRRQDRTTCVAC